MRFQHFVVYGSKDGKWNLLGIVDYYEQCENVYASQMSLYDEIIIYGIDKDEHLVKTIKTRS